MKRRNIASLAVLAVLLSPIAAHATLIDYKIVGVAGAGSSVDIGGGSIDVSGQSYTVTGFTLSDTNVGSYAASPNVGEFATVATFAFAGGLSFISDATTDMYWFQDCGPITSMSCAGLLNDAATEGVFTYFSPIAISDVKVGQTFAGLAPSSNWHTGFSNATNSAGHLMTLLMGGTTSVSYIEATARRVPEPGTLSLLGLGLLGWTVSRSRRKA